MRLGFYWFATLRQSLVFFFCFFTQASWALENHCKNIHPSDFFYALNDLHIDLIEKSHALHIVTGYFLSQMSTDIQSTNQNAKMICEVWPASIKECEVNSLRYQSQKNKALQDKKYAADVEMMLRSLEMCLVAKYKTL